MRVLVAGATSVPGIPLLRELNSRGHDVIGVTRAPGSGLPNASSASPSRTAVAFSRTAASGA